MCLLFFLFFSVCSNYWMELISFHLNLVIYTLLYFIALKFEAVA